MDPAPFDADHGMALLQAQQFDAAEHYFKQHVPEHAVAWYGLGLVYFRRDTRHLNGEQVAAIIPLFEAAIARSSEFADAHFMCGMARAALAGFQLAALHTQRVALSEPRLVEAETLLAMADADWHETLRLDPRFGDLVRNERSNLQRLETVAQHLRTKLAEQTAERQTPPPEPAVSTERVRERVRFVAECANDRQAFEARAQQVAAELGPAALELLAAQFHAEHTPPAELAPRFPGLGAWMAARQFAIFEVFYHLGRPALPILRRVAFGVYDWTQGNAIEILCRLAADGIERERILNELRHAMPNMRMEALEYAAGPILDRAANQPSLRDILVELVQVAAFRVAVDAVTS